jgi:uncharacterized SAM-binding protein YcdF (DUF218 family)
MEEKTETKFKIPLLVLIILTALFLTGVLLFLLWGPILNLAGRILLKDMAPEKSDLIVPLRGDITYTRTMEVARLFKKGLADNVFISTELIDSYSKRLKNQGIGIPPEQERLFSILIQSGIPPKQIILDNQPPGGGTFGELKRIREAMRERGYNKIIIVTSWYHTRRVYLMAKEVFKNDNLEFFVVAAKNGISSVSDWWRYRYEARDTLEEFPKILFFYINKILGIGFKDDP